MIDEEQRQKQAELIVQLVKYGDRLTLLRGGESGERDDFLRRVERALPETIRVIRLRASGTLDPARIRKTLADALQLSPGIDTADQLGQAITTALTGQQRVLLVIEEAQQWAATELDGWLEDWRMIERQAPRRLRLALAADGPTVQRIEAHPQLRDAQIMTHVVDLGGPETGSAGDLVAERDDNLASRPRNDHRRSLVVWYGGAAAFVIVLVGLGFFLLSPDERETSTRIVTQSPAEAIANRPQVEQTDDYPWRSNDFTPSREEAAEASPPVPEQAPEQAPPPEPEAQEPATSPEPAPEVTVIEEEPASPQPEATEPPATEPTEPAEPAPPAPEPAESIEAEPQERPAADPTPEPAPEPAETPEVAQTPDAPATERTVTGDEQWFRETPRTRAVVQLAAVGDEAGIERFLKRHDLKRSEIRVFRQQRGDKTLYTITWGDFPSLARARSGVEDLPAELRESKPWARSVNAIRQLLPQ
ncbi:MAG: SPOR domain-containing protein [Halothiobacillaceae bacterium]